MKTEKSKIYVGFKPAVFNGCEAFLVKPEIFRAIKKPTQSSHGKQYAYAVGPFRTMRGAIYMRDFGGGGNPNCICVADAERLAKQQ